MAKLTALQKLLKNPKTARFVGSLKHADLPKGWADDPEIVKMAEDAYREMGTDSPFWQATFGKSKILDAAGKPKEVYHGTARGDRVGDTFRKDRATSGPMAYFTDNKEIAESYAKNKADTSISREGWGNDYRKQFVVDINGKEIPVGEAFGQLPPLTRANIRRYAPEINFDDELENIIRVPGNKNGAGEYGYHLKMAPKQNPIEALYEEWLYSGNLYGQEERFKDVLKLAGLDNVKYKDPRFTDPKVFDVYMNSQKPFDATNISKTLLGKLHSAGRKAEKSFDPQSGYFADNWDKSSISPSAWLEKLDDDIANGTTNAWTVVPDWVTDVLKKQGYDSIMDVGGKGGGASHVVHIPFEPTQVKSVFNRGTFNPDDPNIYKGILGALATGGAAAAGAGEAQAADDAAALARFNELADAGALPGQRRAEEMAMTVPVRYAADPWRGMSLGARAVTEGVLGAPGELANAVISPFTDFRFQNPGVAVADMMGQAKPVTGAEKTMSNVVRGASDALPYIATGAGLAKLGQGAVAQGVGRSLADSPKIQAMLGGLLGLFGGE